MSKKEKTKKLGDNSLDSKIPSDSSKSDIQDIPAEVKRSFMNLIRTSLL